MSTTVNEATDLTGTYEIDPSHTHVGFSVRHAMVTTVRGQFTDLSGEATIDAEQPQNSSVRLVIKTASLTTGNADRDGHLAGADFFDHENFGEIVFASTEVSAAEDIWTITGDLTIKDVTRPITIDFEQAGTARDPFGNLRAGFEGQVKVNRKDWGLEWNAALETGGVLVSDKVTLSFDVSAVKKES